MLLKVHKFIRVEMIRDGGSFALTFENGDANQYILFTRIRLSDVGPEVEDERGIHQEMEITSYDQPVIIDCDPAKRPQNTRTRIYSVLNGPEIQVSWDQARQIISEVGSLALGLSSIHAEWLKRMTAIVEGDGHAPSDWPTRSTWHRRVR